MTDSAIQPRSIMTRPQVIEALRYEISLPPVAAGQRLINERQLAQLLGANRMTVRRSLDDLEKQGLIIRRQGSGTYIRKIPTQAPCPSNYEPMRMSICVVEDSDDQATRLQADPATRQLTIGIWGDMHCTSKANKMILKGIKQRITDMNHCLQTYDLEYAEDGLTPVEHIVEELRQKPCDGYIVTSHMVEPFVNAYRQVWLSDHPPLVQVWPGSAIPNFEPMIQIDNQQAIERAVRILAQQGHTRLKLVDFNTVRGYPSRARVGYELGMKATGLKCMPSLHLQQIEAFSYQWEESFRHFLDNETLPDALCMASEAPLPILYELLTQRGIQVGRDLAIITVANVGIELPSGEAWSAMVFDPQLVGSMAVTTLVDVIVTAGQRLCSFSHQAHWQQGTTHLRCAD